MFGEVTAVQVSTAIVIARIVLVSAFLGLNSKRGDLVISSPNKLLGVDGKSCEIGFRIYHSCDFNKWRDFCIEEADDLFISDYYDRKNCTVFVGVPFLTDVGHNGLNIMIKALLSGCKYNIVLLNNAVHTAVPPWQYLSAVENVHKDAQLFAAAIRQAQARGLVRTDCVVGVGYSLAANTLGHVCRQLDHPCHSIYAIDPAGFLFAPPGPNVPPALHLVSQQDACHVVYLLCTHDILGTKHHLGHVNIILNDGQVQPNCRSGLNKIIYQYCSHSHCNKAFAKAMASPGTCVAKKCDVEGGVMKTCGLGAYRLDVAPDKKYFKCGTREPDIFNLETLPDASCKND